MADNKMTPAPTIDPNSPYAMFLTDAAVEKQGVLIEYGPFYFRVARAGGANNRYRDVLRERLRPHRRALATETMNEDLAAKISREVFAEAVVLGWGSEKYGDGFMIGKTGEKVEFTIENVQQLFKDLPELAADVMNQAQSFHNFRAAIAEQDAGN